MMASTSMGVLKTAVPTCEPVPHTPALVPVINGWTINQIFLATSIACTACTGFICIILIGLHFRWLSNRREQMAIIRVLQLPISWSIYSVNAVRYYSIQPILDPIPKLHEAIAVAAVFQLFVIYLAPDRNTRALFFANAERLNRKRKHVHDRGSLRWFQAVWLAVFQFPLIFLLLLIVQEVLHSTICQSSKQSLVAEIIVEVMTSLSTTVALVGIIRFYRRFKPELKARHALSKIIALKALVAVVINQELIIAIMQGTYGFKGTPTFSYADLYRGLNDFIIAIEMLGFSLLFCWAFNPAEYREQALREGVTRHNVFREAFDALFIADLVRGIWLAMRYAVAISKGRKRFDYTGGVQDSENTRLQQSQTSASSRPPLSVYSRETPQTSNSSMQIADMVEGGKGEWATREMA